MNINKKKKKNLEILGKFRPFLSKKQAFSRKIGAAMPIFQEKDQKKKNKIK